MRMLDRRGNAILYDTLIYKDQVKLRLVRMYYFHCVSHKNLTVIIHRYSLQRNRCYLKIQSQDPNDSVGSLFWEDVSEGWNGCVISLESSTCPCKRRDHQYRIQKYRTPFMCKNMHTAWFKDSAESETSRPSRIRLGPLRDESESRVTSRSTQLRGDRLGRESELTRLT